MLLAELLGETETPDQTASKLAASIDCDASYTAVFRDELRSGLLRSLGPSEFMVLTLLRAMASPRDGCVQLCVDKIAYQTGLSRPTVMKSLDKLCEHGSLVRLPQTYRNAPSRYLVLTHLILRERGAPFGVLQLQYRTRDIMGYATRINTIIPKIIASADKQNRLALWRWELAKVLLTDVRANDGFIRAFGMQLPSKRHPGPLTSARYTFDALTAEEALNAEATLDAMLGSAQRMASPEATQLGLAL